MPAALCNLVLMTVCVAFDITGIQYSSYIVLAAIVALAIVICVRAMKFRSAFARDQKLVGVDLAIKKDK
jgi:hypothetical protein